MDGGRRRKDPENAAGSRLRRSAIEEPSGACLQLPIAPHSFPRNTGIKMARFTKHIPEHWALSPPRPKRTLSDVSRLSRWAWGVEDWRREGFLPTDHVQVSLVKEAALLAVQTRQVENRPDFFMGSGAEGQRFGLVVPPPSVGRCNGGRDHGLGDGEDGRLR